MVTEELVDSLLEKHGWQLVPGDMPLLHPPINHKAATWAGYYTRMMYHGQEIIVPHYAGFEDINEE